MPPVTLLAVQVASTAGADAEALRAINIDRIPPGINLTEALPDKLVLAVPIFSSTVHDISMRQFLEPVELLIAQVNTAYTSIHADS